MHSSVSCFSFSWLLSICYRVYDSVTSLFYNAQCDAGSIDAIISARKSTEESQKSSSTLKRRRYNPEDEETVETAQEEKTDYAKNSDHNNKDSSMTESLKDIIHQISRVSGHYKYLSL